MSSGFSRGLLTAATAQLFSAHVSTTEAHPKGGPTVDESQVIDAVNSIFAAARTDDITRFNSVIAPEFYMFDGGARFDGNATMPFIKAQHDAGKRYEWNVTKPDVHINGNTAWVAYVNRGSITDSSGTMDQKWLESAFLEKQGGRWKIVFLHSTRVPVASQEKHDKGSSF